MAHRYGFGCIIGLNFFLKNSASLLFAFLFLFGNVQICFAMLISTFFGTTKTATVRRTVHRAQLCLSSEVPEP